MWDKVTDDKAKCTFLKSGDRANKYSLLPAPCTFAATRTQEPGQKVDAAQLLDSTSRVRLLSLNCTLFT